MTHTGQTAGGGPGTFSGHLAPISTAARRARHRASLAGRLRPAVETMIGLKVLTPGRSPHRLPEAPTGEAPPDAGLRAERALVWVSGLVGYLLFGAVLLRTVLIQAGTSELIPSVLLLSVFLGLYATAGPMTRRAAWYPPLYLGLQVVVVTALLALPAFPDFVAVLFAALGVQAAQHLTPRQVAGWLIVFAVVTLYFLIGHWGLPSGIAGTAVYLAATGIVTAYGLTSQRALTARARNQSLWRELRLATQQLEASAARQEQLAAARERVRLARELHDSVTQTIFSLTLTTQAALLLLDRDPPRVAGQLDRLEALAGCALSELRSLVAQLHPGRAAGEGLPRALQEHLAARQRQDGLSVTLEVAAPGRLAPAEEENVFRIIQEALNNVVKHAHTNRAHVVLHLAEPAWVQVSDAGRGFQASQAPSAGHLGLAGMRARAEEIGWRLEVTSAPGSGTRVRAERLRVGPARQEGHP